MSVDISFVNHHA
uniref:Uncharacterized protein n=1 Tax=Anguilla anguilla TaxID=7936 RepID=A0A0E9UZ95_ANGAN